jgi:glycine dehydrogenase subunit 2
MHHLQAWLAEIGGFASVSLQPAAGAQGELTALFMIRAYHADRGELQRDQILIPDSAHGTKPASTTMAGFVAVEVPSDERGNIELAALKSACTNRLAGLMITNPNTLGLLDEHLAEVVRLVHECGGLVYGDGANMNALTGVVRPGEAGIDLMHFNLHKTFATPHGGGGPGSGPLGASGALAGYLPGPIVAEETGAEDQEKPSYSLEMPAKSIGRVSSFFGNFGMMVRAYAYIRLLGAKGLRDSAMHAVLNANYLRVRLKDVFPVPYDRMNMHEFVCQGRIEGSAVRALDISKRLMDYGFHPPTNYFPLIVREALMIEPTETESKPTLDAFIEAIRKIAIEARDNPELVRSAPHHMPVGRLDEVKAARELVLNDPAAPAIGTPLEP